MSFLKRLLFAKANNLVVILLSIALGGALATNWSRPNRLYAVDQPTTSAAQKATLHEIEDGFSNIADKVEPTVVTVSARSSARTTDATQPRHAGGRRTRTTRTVRATTPRLGTSSAGSSSEIPTRRGRAPRRARG